MLHFNESLPLFVGLFSVLVDLLVTPSSPTSQKDLYVTLATCHVIAMTSAVSNPIVYGWLNSNIRREFLQLLPASCACSAHRNSSSEGAKAATMGERVLIFVFIVAKNNLTLTSEGRLWKYIHCDSGSVIYCHHTKLNPSCFPCSR
jgi:hypothetical protein